MEDSSMAGELALVMLLLAPSSECLACHNGIATAAGHDISIGADWQTSMMANSARDPYWQAAVRRETIDHPESAAAIEAECSKCHMPMNRGAVFAKLADPLAVDGVSCALCHRIEPDHFGERESAVGGFVLASEPVVYGPFDVDAGRRRVMSSATGFTPTKRAHLRTSEMCATCHTLYTHALAAGGSVLGELPEQVPYLEWRHSEYRDKKTCDECHMPLVQEDAPITSVLGQPRTNVNRHEFRGGNFLVRRMLGAGGAERTIEHLQTEAARLTFRRLEVVEGVARGEIEIDNLAGHKLPTAYPSRRVWLHLVVRDTAGHVMFESGRLRGDGSIEGNDNDHDAARYEQHWTRIESADQVQIWEAILRDGDGNVTTGLLRGTDYLKDNRILPKGFVKATAGHDIAVRGSAASDHDFTGGHDRIEFAVPAGPTAVSVEAELLYQPISFRWAENLRGYDTAESKRFASLYDSMAGQSAVVLARAIAMR
jgi:hypothetical protein